MKNMLLILMIGMFLISLVGAECIKPDCIGTYKQNQCVLLPQICDDCTYNNISSILDPNSNIILSEVAMTKDGTFYSYSFCNTTMLGNYQVSGYGNENGVKSTWGGSNYYFQITPSGFENTVAFFGIFILIIVLLFVMGMILKNNWIMMLGSFLVLILGFFIIINGIDLIKDTTTTWAIGIIVWAIGIYFMFLSVEEQLKEWD